MYYSQPEIGYIGLIMLNLDVDPAIFHVYERVLWDHPFKTSACLGGRGVTIGRWSKGQST